MSILHVTPSHIQVKVGSRTITIECETFARGYGSPDFVIISSSIRRWDKPHDSKTIDAATKQEILSLLKAEMMKRNWSVEIE
jgi:Immunity protein 74